MVVAYGIILVICLGTNNARPSTHQLFAISDTMSGSLRDQRLRMLMLCS